MRSLRSDHYGRRRAVRGDGSNLFGPGWRRITNGTGDYTIVFDKPFAAPPNVDAIVINTGTALVARLYTIDKNSFRIMIFVSSSGANADSGFFFKAEGVDGN